MTTGGIDFTVYQRISQIGNKIDKIIQDAMLMKGELDRFPMMEAGVGKIVNLIV